MKILNPTQIQKVDLFTIENEPIASIDLMERAAKSCTKRILELYPDRDTPICIGVGPGNNGGDGLAIARLLYQEGYLIQVFVLALGGQQSQDFSTNYERLESLRMLDLISVQEVENIPHLGAGTVFIDAFFGSGLNRPLNGLAAQVVEHINQMPVQRISIDIPSGLFADRHTTGPTIQADRTLSLQLPKLAFFMAENSSSVGLWEIIPIGLSNEAIENAPTQNFTIEESTIRSRFRKRHTYDHKGTFGHILLISGSYGKMGAALLAGEAVLRTGAGLLTIHIPECGYQIVQTHLPEAMVHVDPHRSVTTAPPCHGDYECIAMGPGIGTNDLTAQGLLQFLKNVKSPLVLDADALNLIAAHNWQNQIPAATVLTPHPKEFERLFGKADDGFARLELLREQAKKLHCYILLKGAHTAIALPDGTIYFNCTGNPGMATAGSGDVLTGILASLIGQGYPPADACLMGVYLHGLAGDLAASKWSQEAMIARDIIYQLGAAFNSFE